ncbi:hypothetical protein N8216_00670 [Flavobacteriaceae bacterium]|nr:hypothetical protein [Flavobacteriaceae bacterium]
MNQKHKNRALVVCFLFVVFLCYKLAIKNTLQLKNQQHNLAKEAVLLKNAPQQLAQLKQKEIYYDSLLTKYQLDGSSIQNNLLKVITTFASNNNLKVIDFLEPHVSTNGELVIKTYDFTLEGNYNNSNQLIYLLEQHTKFGEIISLHFEKKKNYRTGRFYLQTRVLLKSFG